MYPTSRTKKHRPSSSMGPAADAQLQGNAGQPPMASALDSFPGVTFHFYLFFVIRVSVAGFLPELIYKVSFFNL